MFARLMNSYIQATMAENRAPDGRPGSMAARRSIKKRTGAFKSIRPCAARGDRNYRVKRRKLAEWRTLEKIVHSLFTQFEKFGYDTSNDPFYFSSTESLQ
jgi:hypothetical protein